MSQFLAKANQLACSELIFQTGLSFAVRVLAALSGFLVSLVIGRQLGAEQAGYYFLAFNIVMVLGTLSRAGLDNTVIRFVGGALPDGAVVSMRLVLQRALLVTLALSVPTAALLWWLSEPLAVLVFNKPALAPVLATMAPGLVLLALFTLLGMGLQGVRRVVASVVSINITVNALVIVGLVVLGSQTASEAAFLYVLAGVLSVGLAAWLMWCALARVEAQAQSPSASEPIRWRQLFDSCIPLWVVAVMALTVEYAGQFIAAAWVAPEQVAQLAVAQRTAMLTSMVLMAVNMVVAPRFAALYKQGEHAQLQKLALTSVKLMVLSALPIVGLMMLIPEWLLGLFGEGFSGGAHLLQIMAIGQFVNVATGSVALLLTMSGHEKDFRNTVLISGPLAIALGFALVPFLGATGSAIATAIAVATQNLVAVYWVKKRLGFNTLAVWR